jgi:nickel/cobalt transporter (NiCoT) family protein
MMPPSAANVSPQPGVGSHRTALTRLYALLVAANVAAWLWAWTAFHDRPALLGMALLAWLLGLRHAVDADHIAAIDNAVRKLMQDGQPAASVGFFFALGHSTIVVLAAMAIAGALHGGMGAFAAGGATIGTLVSATFLLVIALANLVILCSVWRSFRKVSRGRRVEPADMDTLLSGGGLLARLFAPVFRSLSRCRHMYPIGVLFGLGFDTATEIGLLGISAAQVAQGISPWQTLVFPALFTAGMSLVDTTDSVLMVGAYRWAFIHPLRKLWYNLTITAASVIVALLIGGIEALGLLADQLGLQGGFWSVVSALNERLPNLGFAVIGIFVAAWALSAAVYRWKRYNLVATAGSGGGERRYSSGAASPR